MVVETSKGNASMSPSMDTSAFISIMQMRLDTTKLLADMEAYLRGTRVVGYQDEEGQVKPVFDTFGRPRMNEAGIQDMMSWLSSLFSPQTVQGNTKEDDFEDFMARLQADLAQDLMNKMPDYEIKESDYEGIIDKVMACAEMFFSRTKDNLERESYAATIRSIERIGEEKKSGWGFNPFGKK